MRRGADSLSVLRSDAREGVEALIELVSVGRLMGIGAPDESTIRNGVGVVDGFDIAALSADSRALVSAHRAVSEQLHHLPEQQVRLDDGWNSESATVAIATVIDHQRRAESDLHILRTLTEATSAAASGIDRLLRTFYLTLARLSAPAAAGVPPAELPQAVLTGRVPMGVAVEDISSRLALFTTSLETTTRGVAGILDLLNRSVDGIDDEAYPVDAERSGRVPSAMPDPPPATPDPPVASAPVHTVAAPSPVTQTWLAESTTEDRTHEIGAASASAVSASAPDEVEAARAVPEPDDGIDIPFRLGGTEGLDAPVATVEEATAETGPAETEPEPAETGSADTEPAGPDSPAPTPDASSDRSSGDLALAGDQ
ncbi:hypothetical protein [Gordonia terrae]|uniref:Uncharacterized protein n=2 Tax=Gordonia terrae TaxID=2055 RepID=A0AAD0KAW9_9ACTN|nr:hypothetical protein [Gordonia terrae]VTR07377.1 Uncharacterised protein [Clostridioides difficile]ANY22895.1 hypothetical protein BCM27_08870 [Gordonia terrae]AWO83627.1 hypothetical protein DLJ61_08955 [Gordonia terrae]VTS44221.1 Uncharacterised protein [Gordonia terrae]GAB42443.1 hypothetical protein GOTRE_017_00030 [Gordonia terrae NBRC 100016]